MSPSDAMLIRRLTGALVRIGRYSSYGARFLLVSYDATEQIFIAAHHPSMAPAGTISAAAVLLAKRHGILHTLR